MSGFALSIAARDGAARVGQLATAHGVVHTPAFMPVGTAGTVKAMTPDAVRATGADVDDAMPLARQIGNMGMALYSAQPPTGYSMKADTWVSSSALLNRMNFALGLTAGKVKGVKVDSVQLAGGPPAPADASVALTALEAKLLAGDVSAQTHDSIMAQITSPQIASAQVEAAKNTAPSLQDKDKGKKNQQRKPPDAPRPPDASTIAGLLLGSPEFQKR